VIDAQNCRITHYPAAVLARPAEPVEEIDDNIRGIVDKMADIMLENKGVGLAGPQAGVSLQIFIASLDGTKAGVKAYINPTIATSGSAELMEEGCLSLPGIRVKVRRYNKCVVTATGLDGKEFTEEAEGLLAEVFQHEYDHLQGMVITDKIGRVAKMAVRKRLKELEKIYENDVKKGK